jgi:hypothetical protein
MEGAFDADNFTPTPPGKGIYWSICAKEPVDDTVGSDGLTKMKCTLNVSGMFPLQTISYCYSNTDKFLGQNLVDFQSFKCKSYFLSNVTNVKPVQITNLSFDDSFYAGGLHDEHIPRFVQKSDLPTPPPPHYDDVNEWSHDIGWYYKNDNDNMYQALYDLEYFLVNREHSEFLLRYKTMNGNEYDGLPWQNNDGNTNILHWNSIADRLHLELNLQNTNPNAQPWRNKVYLFWEINKCFAAMGTPRWCPDPGSNNMWDTQAYPNVFAFPPSVNLPVELL